MWWPPNFAEPVFKQAERQPIAVRALFEVAVVYEHVEGIVDAIADVRHDGGVGAFAVPSSRPEDALRSCLSLNLHCR